VSAQPSFLHAPLWLVLTAYSHALGCRLLHDTQPKKHHVQLVQQKEK
jgi:hypothetical protein